MYCEFEFSIGHNCLPNLFSSFICFMIEKVNIMLISLPDTKITRDKRNLRELVNYSKKPILDSGNYRHGFTITEMKLMDPGHYALIVSTYDGDQLGKFMVTIEASEKITTNYIA